MARTQKMKDVERNLPVVNSIYEELTNIRAEMAEISEGRMAQFNAVKTATEKFELAKKTMSKIKRHYKKGKIDGEEFLRAQNEFGYIKREFKRAIRKNQQEAHRIQELNARESECKRKLWSRIDGNVDYAELWI